MQIKRKAEKRRAQFERELRMGIVAPGSLKLSDFIDDSVRRTRGQVGESTLVQYQIAMKRFIDAVGDIDIQSVMHKHGEQYIQACLDRGNSPATANKNLRSLKRLFELAVDRGQLEENPLRRVKNPRVPRKKVRVYSAAECDKLILAAKEFSSQDTLDWDSLIVVALCTGMRRGELLNTIWSDIDFEAKTIHVSPEKRYSRNMAVAYQRQ